VANLQAKGGGNACGRNLKIAGQNSGFSQEIPETPQNRRK